MGKVNIEMDEALHRAVKIKAIEAGKTMKDYIVEILREAVMEKEGGEDG